MPRLVPGICVCSRDFDLFHGFGFVPGILDLVIWVCSGNLSAKVCSGY